MSILIGIIIVSAYAATLWLTQTYMILHLAILTAVIPAAFLFGYLFGLSGGFLVAIGVMLSEIAIIHYIIVGSTKPKQNQKRHA